MIDDWRWTIPLFAGTSLLRRWRICDIRHTRYDKRNAILNSPSPRDKFSIFHSKFSHFPPIIRVTCTNDAKFPPFFGWSICLNSYLQRNKKIFKKSHFCSKVPAFLIDFSPKSPWDAVLIAYSVQRIAFRKFFSINIYPVRYTVFSEWVNKWMRKCVYPWTSTSHN